MRIAWDDDSNFWSGDLSPDGSGSWRMSSGVPISIGRTVTITPLTGERGPHVQFRAEVVGSGEDVLESPYSEGRFWTRLRAIKLDPEAERFLYRARAAARSRLAA